MKRFKMLVAMVMVMVMLVAISATAFCAPASTTVAKYEYKTYSSPRYYTSWTYLYTSWDYMTLNYDSSHGFFSTSSYLGVCDTWLSGFPWLTKYKKEKTVRYYYDAVTFQLIG